MKHSQLARRVDVFAGSSHSTEQKHYPSAPIRLPFPTADSVELSRAAHQLLPQVQEGHQYARAGLILTNLLPAGVHPLEPFRQPHEDAGGGAVVDGVQKTTGRDALGLGYSGFRPSPLWQECSPPSDDPLG